MADFFRWTDPQIRPELIRALLRDVHWNEEGIIYGVKFGDEELSSLKMYLFDLDSQFAYKSGVMFRDHYSAEDVRRTFMVADAFEKFLKRCLVEYERTNPLRAGR
jgi:hypothetical protein